MHEVKGVGRQDPLVFKVVDSEADIGRDVGGLDGGEVDTADDRAGELFGDCNLLATERSEGEQENERSEEGQEMRAKRGEKKLTVHGPDARAGAKVIDHTAGFQF